MESPQLDILHEHYRDSCSLMQGQRTARDRYFYLVIAVVTVAWFDVVTPQDFSAIVGEILKSHFQLTVAPDLAYLRSVLWFLLLGITIRYFQTSLSVERSYDYIHDLEAVLAKEVHNAFGREGAAYLSKYPLFLRWAHFLYVIATPAILLAVVFRWTVAQLRAWNPAHWTGLDWFDVLVSAAIAVSVVLYWRFRIKKSDVQSPLANPGAKRSRR